jgi:hypothetical protein
MILDARVSKGCSGLIFRGCISAHLGHCATFLLNGRISGFFNRSGPPDKDSRSAPRLSTSSDLSQHPLIWIPQHNVDRWDHQEREQRRRARSNRSEMARPWKMGSIGATALVLALIGAIYVAKSQEIWDCTLGLALHGKMLECETRSHARNGNSA